MDVNILKCVSLAFQSAHSEYDSPFLTNSIINNTKKVLKSSHNKYSFVRTILWKGIVGEEFKSSLLDVIFT